MFVVAFLLFNVEGKLSHWHLKSFIDFHDFIIPHLVWFITREKYVSLILIVSFISGCSKDTVLDKCQKPLCIEWFSTHEWVDYILCAGWHAYFWISFIPLIVSNPSHFSPVNASKLNLIVNTDTLYLSPIWQLLLAVGTKLEHIIFELAHEVAQRHVAVQGELLVKPSDHHFWFNKPRLVLVLIHIILFQNAFEIAVFFWMLVREWFTKKQYIMAKKCNISVIYCIACPINRRYCSNFTRASWDELFISFLDWSSGTYCLDCCLNLQNLLYHIDWRKWWSVCLILLQGPCAACLQLQYPATVCLSYTGKSSLNRQTARS